MGRSVSVPRNAIATVYIHLEYDDESDDAWEFDDLIDRIVDTVCGKYPSFEKEDNTWLSNEERVVLQNGLAQIVVAEYCGLVSVSLVPIEFEYWGEEHKNNIALAWCQQIESGWEVLMRQHFDTMVKLGTFSNGESVYRKV